jgi:predicted DNA-binding transcriptional regulator YafY
MWGNLAKLFRVMDILSRPDGATKKEIADITGTQKRQVDRIINAIGNMGIPVYDDRPDGEREKVWFIEEGYLRKLPNMAVPDPDFTLPELFVLSFIKGSSSIFHNTEISRYAESSFEKLKGFASSKLFEVFERMESAFVNRFRFLKNYSGLEDIIMEILEAIIGRKKSIIRYNSFKSGEVKEYHVKPLHFFEDNGGLYLMVQIDSTGDVYTFALERIHSVEITSEFFDYPSDFDAAEFLNRPFGLFMDDCFECRIWFSSRVAKYIRERPWSDNQKITENSDGSIILQMQTCGWFDVKRWVLSYGKDARVLEPEKMRMEILEEIKIIAESYQSENYQTEKNQD